MTTRHQLRTFDRTVMVPALDALAADGWELLACWPEGAGYQCLLVKPNALERFLNTPFAQINPIAAARDQLRGEQEET